MLNIDGTEARFISGGIVEVPPYLEVRGRYTIYDKGCLGNGETPVGERGRRDPGLNAVREEARQLARGKRVVPQTPQALKNATAPLCKKRLFQIVTERKGVFLSGGEREIE